MSSTLKKPLPAAVSHWAASASGNWSWRRLNAWNWLEPTFLRRRRERLLHNVDLMAKRNRPRAVFTPLAASHLPALQQLHRQIIDFGSCPTCLAAQDQLPRAHWNAIDAIPGGTSRHEVAPKSRLRPEYVCPDCGFPTHCSPSHHQEDLEQHRLVCGTLRQWVEDEHDAASGRKRWELSFPGHQSAEGALNFTGWPYLFTSRKFPRSLLQSPPAQRHVSRLLTYPYTIASLFHHPWAYLNTDPNHPIVTETGWHTLSGLSYAVDLACKSAQREMHKFKQSRSVTFTVEPTAPTLSNDPFRLFILGPRVECRLPAFVWEQLSMVYPGVPFRVYFIGPDAQPSSIPVSAHLLNREDGFRSRSLVTAPIHQRFLGRVHVTGADGQPCKIDLESTVVPVNVNLRMEFIRAPYEAVHSLFNPFRKNRDMFVFFNSGVGHFATRDQWKPALEKVLDTRCLAFFTSLNEPDQAIQEDWNGKYQVTIRPTRNAFASLRPDLAADCVHDPEQIVYCNWGMFAVQGIGSDVHFRLDDFQVESTDRPKSVWGWA